jgi:hypothetical protein
VKPAAAKAPAQSIPHLSRHWQSARRRAYEGRGWPGSTSVCSIQLGLDNPLESQPAPAIHPCSVSVQRQTLRVGWCYTKQLGSSAEQRCNASLCSCRISQHLGLGGSYGTASGLATPGRGFLGLGWWGRFFPCPLVDLGLGLALLSCLACQLHDILQFCPQPCPLSCLNLVRCELCFQQLIVGDEFVRSHGVAIYHHTHLGTHQTVAGHTPLFSSTLSQ